MNFKEIKLVNKGTIYTLEVVYIPNEYVGPIEKEIGAYTSLHDAWQGIKEFIEREV